jgi:glycosyltransferase involved in cell wall biosynthesis
VLFLGRLKFHKGLEYLIESAKYTDPNVKYLLVGEGDYEPRLRNLVATLKLQDRIIFTGRALNEDIPKYYAACDIFILPSITRLEAFGLVVIEAMASGKPVIISNIPGVSENNLLLSDKKLRLQMGARGRKNVEERCDLKKVVNQIEKVYKDIAK